MQNWSCSGTYQWQNHAFRPSIYLVAKQRNTQIPGMCTYLQNQYRILSGGNYNMSLAYNSRILEYSLKKYIWWYFSSKYWNLIFMWNRVFLAQDVKTTRWWNLWNLPSLKGVFGGLEGKERMDFDEDEPNSKITIPLKMIINIIYCIKNKDFTTFVFSPFYLAQPLPVICCVQLTHKIDSWCLFQVV